MTYFNGECQRHEVRWGRPNVNECPECECERRAAEAHDAAIRADERAKIVMWLRSIKYRQGEARRLADAIERGVHA